MENKPTIREEFFERWGGVELDGLEAEVADWWLNKIKEVVGEEVYIPENISQSGKTDLMARNHERQRILKEFGLTANK